MEPMIRGYSVKQQFTFLETQYDSRVRDQLIAAIPDDVQRALREVKPGEWYPRYYSVCVLRAIASHHHTDEGKVYDDLVRCGTFIATEATNTFLKLLMKLLTPTLFAKKIPEFWERDQKGGRFEVDLADAKDGRLQLALRDVEGFDHIGALGVGWISFALRAMGKSDVNVKQRGWSLASPGPKDVTYDVSWS